MTMPERVWVDPVVRLHDDEGGWWYFDKRQVDESPYVPESRLLAAEARVREVEAERDALLAGGERAVLDYMSHKSDRVKEENAALRADLAALAKVLERVVLAGRYINIAPPRNDDANRQSDHDEFYAANEHGEAAARAVLDRHQEGA